MGECTGWPQLGNPAVAMGSGFFLLHNPLSFLVREGMDPFLLPNLYAISAAEVL